MGVLLDGIRPPSHPRDWDAAIRRVATAQHHAISILQLHALGVRDGAIRRRVACGSLWRVLHGVFAVGRRELSRRGWWTAGLLSAPPGSALSHWSAASAHDLMIERGPEIHLATLGRRGRTQPGLQVHRPRELIVADLTTVDGLPVTSVARLLLDLAAEVTPSRLARLLERAQQLGVYDQAALDDVLARAGGHRGAGRLRRALPDAQPPVTRSQLERDFLHLCRNHALPPPTMNAVVAGYEVDAYWPDRQLVVELDGFRFHRTRAAQESDRQRDLSLKLAGIELLRLTHSMVHHQPGRVASAIRTLRDRGT